MIKLMNKGVKAKPLTFGDLRVGDTFTTTEVPYDSGNIYMKVDSVNTAHRFFCIIGKDVGATWESDTCDGYPVVKVELEAYEVLR